MCHWRITPGHGYLVLSPKEQAKMPEFARMKEYEEDCDWAIPVVVMPELLKQKSFGKLADVTHEDAVKEAHRVCMSWNPDIYEKLTGHKVTAAESIIVQAREFLATNADRWITVAAWGDWHELVPEGYVAVKAVVGGEAGDYNDHSFWLVKKERYDAREGYPISYVIDPEVDIRMKEMKL